MPEEETNLDVSALLPLDKSIYWAQIAEITSGIADASDAYTSAVFGFKRSDLGETTAEWNTAGAAGWNSTAIKRRVKLANYYMDIGGGDMHYDYDADPENPTPRTFPTKNSNSSLNGRIGDIGNKDTNRRQDWFNLLKRANGEQILSNPLIDNFK